MAGGGWFVIAGKGLVVGLAMVLAVEKFLLWSVPWCFPPSDTCCGRARGCARLQLVWIDRVFPGLSNGVGLVSFAHLVVKKPKFAISYTAHIINLIVKDILKEYLLRSAAEEELSNYTNTPTLITNTNSYIKLKA